MKLYDGIIASTEELLKGLNPVSSAYDPARCWKDHKESELIMKRDAAFELGGSNKPSVNFTCVTSSGIIDKDEVIVCGPDLQDITEDCSFARIVFLEVGDLGEDEDAYQAIRNLEFVRYHIFPTGYMIRVSSTSNQEQVRVSKKVVSAGIKFAYIGNAYIRKYLAVPGVKHVRVMFVADSPVVNDLIPTASKVDSITKTLTHILDGIPTDCGHCSMKSVCDEVEGLKEAHMARAKKQKALNKS